MIGDALGEEQQQLLTEVDILEELPQREVDYLATSSPTVRLSKKRTLTQDGDLHSVYPS
jgi:hypothetical protein